MKNLELILGLMIVVSCVADGVSALPATFVHTQPAITAQSNACDMSGASCSIAAQELPRQVGDLSRSPASEF